MNRRELLAGIAALLASGKALRDEPLPFPAADGADGGFLVDRAMVLDMQEHLEESAFLPINLGEQRFSVSIPVPNEMLEDADPDLQRLIQEEFRKSMAEMHRRNADAMFGGQS